MSGVRRKYTTHGSTLITRSAARPRHLCLSITGKPRHSFLPNRTQGAEWTAILHSAFCILHSPAAREWYRPPLTPQGPSTQWASLCAGHRGLFSVFAYLTGAVYHRGGGMSSGCGYQSSRRGGVGLPPNGVLSPAVRSQPWPDGLGRQVSQVSARV